MPLSYEAAAPAAELALRAGGEAVRVPPGGLLLDGGRLWVVRSGAVRLFAVPIEADGGQGRRGHLFDVSAGGTLFGTGPAAGGRNGAEHGEEHRADGGTADGAESGTEVGAKSGAEGGTKHGAADGEESGTADGDGAADGPGDGLRMAVLASALGDAELIGLPREAAANFPSGGVQARDWLIGAAERWIDEWHLALAADGLAAQSLTLRRQETTVVAEPSAIRSPEGVLWVRAAGPAALVWHARGTRLAVEGLERTAFPLGAAARCDVVGPAELTAEDTDSLWRERPQWAALDAFHAAALAALLRLRREEDEDELERLRRRADNEARFLHRAVARLREVHEDEPAVRAAEPTEAGGPLLAAVRAIGRSMDMDVRPARTETAAEGAEGGGAQALQAIADASRFRVRQVKLEGRWWREDHGPLLVYGEEDGRPLAALPRRPGRYELYDPADGSFKPLTAEEAGRLRGTAYTFYKPLPARSLKLTDIVRLSANRHSLRDMAAMLSLGIVIGLIGLFSPIASGLLFDSIIPAADRTQLVEMAFVLGGSSVAVFLFELARGTAVTRLESRVDMSLQSAVWDRLLRLPTAFFRNYSAGDLAMRANSINAIRKQLSGIALNTLFSGLFSSFNLALLFRYDAGIALLALGLVAFGIAVSAGFALIQIGYQRKLMQNQGKLSSLMLQLLSGIAKFRIAAAESRAFYLWANLFGAMNRIGYKSNKLQSYFAVYQAVFPVATSMALYYAVATMGQGRMTAGEFIAFFSAFSTFLAAMLSVSSSLLSVMGVVTLYERAKPILQALPEEAGGGEHPGRLNGHLELSRVCFRYDRQGDWVLRDVSFTVKPGEMVAIVGESGSGKSTLVRLLLGFEQPESGMVRYDGRELASLDAQAVRRQIGVVLQQADVMAGNLYENIVGSAGLPLEAAWEAAAMAGLAKDILAMPMGMHTLIPDGGGTLSGGQRQRLLIARAVVRKPKILIFDEATSALDNRTQAEVSASLERLQATRIVIAHRLSTVRRADRILVVRKGAIVESGTYDELIAGGGEFARMAERQVV